MRTLNNLKLINTYQVLYSSINTATAIEFKFNGKFHVNYSDLVFDQEYQWQE